MQTVEPSAGSYDGNFDRAPFDRQLSRNSRNVDRLRHISVPQGCENCSPLKEFDTDRIAIAPIKNADLNDRVGTGDDTYYPQ